MARGAEIDQIISTGSLAGKTYPKPLLTYTHVCISFWTCSAPVSIIFNFRCDCTTLITCSWLYKCPGVDSTLLEMLKQRTVAIREKEMTPEEIKEFMEVRRIGSLYFFRLYVALTSVL